MEVTIKTDQLQILEDFFNDLSAANQRKIFIEGFRKASIPLIAAAKSNAPHRRGILRKSIGTVAIPNEIAILVGAKKSGTYKGWHGHLVENGTVERFRKTKQGATTGKVIGTHFFEQAFNQTQEQVYSTIENEWYNAIDKFIVKTNKKLK